MSNNNGEQKTTGQKIGGTAGRYLGAFVGVGMAVLNDCLVGNRDKGVTQETRRKYMDGGESIGSAVGKIVETISESKKGRMK